MYPESSRRVLLRLVVLGAAVLASSAPVLAGSPKCTCPDGNGSYWFLNAPVSPPDDPCHCPFCEAFPGQCKRVIPKGWDPVCFDNRKMECFLRRHAASWRLSCSERLDGVCACNNPHPEFCPFCGNHGSEWDEGGMKVMARQVEIERRIHGRKKFVLIKSPHFYLFTDIRSMKIRTRDGGPRVIGMHEIAHLYIQRCEIAYMDFVEHLGARVSLGTPMAVYLCDKNRTMEDIQATYFGSPRTNIIYGGGSKRIAGGYPGNGFATSLQKGGDDYGLHLQVRHSVGHILMSCWVQVNGQEKYLPKWMYCGAGHWLARYHPRLAEMATFCADEGTPLSNSGRNWDAKLVKYAADSNPTPIQRIFDTGSMSSMTLEMHQRAWSWFAIFLEEDRERFVNFLAAIRKGTDHRTALKEAFGCSPEEFDQRWCERILGKRPTVAPTAEELDAGDPSRPGARERASIRTETDPLILAAKIKSLQAVNDPLTAATVIPLLRTESERVRETIVLVMSRTKSPVVRDWLRTEGLSGHKGIVRAYVARIIGNLKDEEAGPYLLRQADDGYWLTRAHVARALGLVQYAEAIPKLKEMAKDQASKVRIMAFDSLGRFGEKAASAWVVASDQLSATAWQVRSAAAECLGELGEMAACEPLIDRMETEEGRLRKDIHEALKKITRDDLGQNPKYWRDWWEKEKERHGGIPPRDERKEPPKGGIVYGEEPTYYGLRVFSRGIGYVLDTSSSMLSTIKVDPNWIKKQRREYPAQASKFDLAWQEIAASLRSLDPRVRFNLYFFRARASHWKKDMVPASPGNTESAIGRLQAERPQPAARSASGKAASSTAYSTNYVDVFRMVLDVKEGDDVRGNFGDTPDTIYFLTDGEPTAGDITDTDVLASWFRELNRFARMRVNVITFGQLGVDPEFLKRLAEENGGVFVQVPEVR